MMKTRAGRSVSGARPRPIAIPVPVWFPPLTELAFGLPMRIAHLVAVLSRPGSRQLCRDGIAVSPMSGEWLQKCVADSGKRGDVGP